MLADEPAHDGIGGGKELLGLREAAGVRVVHRVRRGDWGNNVQGLNINDGFLRRGETLGLRPLQRARLL